VLRGLGVVFLLTRMDVNITRLPAAGEKISVYTWFAALRRAEFVRQFRVTGSGGGTLVEAVSLWVTADPDSHRIVRPDAFPFKEKAVPYTGDSVEVPQLRVKASSVADGAWRVTERPVRWSDIDFNAHMNNTVYADLICDCFPGGMTGRELEYFGISFRGEAVEGDTLAIRSALCGGGAVFECRAGGRRCFEAAARLRE
jgi:acyl-ACP thioesterase